MKKILVCIDGSLYGQVCCQYALWVAKKFGSQVEMLYVSELWQYEAPLVADFGGSLGAQPYMGLTTQLQQIEEEKSAALRDYVFGVFEKEGLRANVTFNHRTGVLVDCIEELDKNGDEVADLVLIGKRGEGANMAKAHLGSNMERVVRACERPCFVANREFFDPKKVLVAYDGSESAGKALVWYAENKKAFAGTEIHVVSVARQGEEDKASERIRIAESILKAAEITPVCQVLNGAAADAIANYQQSSGCNFLLMGAYGHSKIRRLIIGSTTTEILQRCRIPIVMFR